MTLRSKKRAKLLHFFYMTKYSCKKNQKMRFFLFFVIFTCLCARMGCHIYTAYLLKRGMRIDLRGAERGMPKQRLYGSDIRTVVQHGRSEGMAQHVRRMFLERRDLAHTRAHYII